MIITLDDLTDVHKRHIGQKQVMTSGTFDLFHVGHLGYLKQVKRYGDVLIVLLSGDSRVKLRKGPNRPIIPEHDRAAILDALRMVDYVLIDPSKMSPNETDPVHAKILGSLKPDYYVTDGPDPRFFQLMDKSQFVMMERTILESSTSSIVERIIRFDSRSKSNYKE